MTFGQGVGWPDVGVLTHNGYRVVLGEKYENLFLMLQAGRFDAFPRGVFEPWSELITHEEKNLAVEGRFLFEYPMPVYFYVANHRKRLAPLLESGLRSAIADGSFDEHFNNSPAIKQMYENLDFSNRITCVFENPNTRTRK